MMVIKNVQCPTGRVDVMKYESVIRQLLQQEKVSKHFFFGYEKFSFPQRGSEKLCYQMSISVCSIFNRGIVTVKRADSMIK